MVLLEDKNRDYRRYRPSAEEKVYLSERGLRWVLSSNVSAAGTQGNSLIIRFHNGSVYEYPGQADRIDDLFNSNSKGRWVWRELRRKKVPYRRIGTVSLSDDISVSDEDILSIGNRPPSVFELVAGEKTVFDLLLDEMLPSIKILKAV